MTLDVVLDHGRSAHHLTLHFKAHINFMSLIYIYFFET